MSSPITSSQPLPESPKKPVTTTSVTSTPVTTTTVPVTTTAGGRTFQDITDIVNSKEELISKLDNIAQRVKDLDPAKMTKCAIEGVDFIVKETTQPIDPASKKSQERTFEIYLLQENSAEPEKWIVKKDKRDEIHITPEKFSNQTNTSATTLEDIAKIASQRASKLREGIQYGKNIENTLASIGKQFCTALPSLCMGAITFNVGIEDPYFDSSDPKERMQSENFQKVNKNIENFQNQIEVSLQSKEVNPTLQKMLGNPTSRTQQDYDNLKITLFRVMFSELTSKYDDDAHKVVNKLFKTIKGAPFYENLIYYEAVHAINNAVESLKSEQEKSNYSNKWADIAMQAVPPRWQSSGQDSMLDPKHATRGRLSQILAGPLVGAPSSPEKAEKAMNSAEAKKQSDKALLDLNTELRALNKYAQDISKYLIVVKLKNLNISEDEIMKQSLQNLRVSLRESLLGILQIPSYNLPNALKSTTDPQKVTDIFKKMISDKLDLSLWEEIMDENSRWLLINAINQAVEDVKTPNPSGIYPEESPVPIIDTKDPTKVPNWAK